MSLELVYPPSSIIVIKDNKPASDVARAMIESGDQKNSFYLLDFDEVYNCVQNFKNKMPRLNIFYAMKSNDDSMMLRLAIALGLGFDCASPGEIDKIRKHNVRPTSIIYAVTIKTPEQMMFARRSGVKHTTFDSLCELKRLNQYWPDSKLLIRVKLESKCLYKLGDKFGCDYMEAVSLLNEAAQLGMRVIGVAFHVGGACFSAQSYADGIQMARALFDHEAREGRRMVLLDIGGGFFNKGYNNFDQVADMINDGLAKWFPDPEVQVIAEPGRYICESAFTLYSNIRGTRTVIDSGKKIKMVYLNNGTHGRLRFVEKWHDINKFERTKDIEHTEDIHQETIIWGPTLDNTDSLGLIKLASLSVDDWLVFCYQGAYCSVCKTDYCSIEITNTRCVVSEGLWAKLKDKAIFSTCDFVMDSEIAPVLLSTFAVLVDDVESIMNGTEVYVLEKHSPDDVARAMIESGNQMQPFYIFNMDEAHRRVQHFHKMMPRVKIFYAVKANDTEIMLKLIAALGLGFDCASAGEIHKIWKLNVNPKSIIYAMPCKTAEEMEYASKAGVKHTTFDSSYELKKIKKSWPDARLLLRIRVHGTVKYNQNLKFGCDQSEAFALLDEAAILGLDVAGIAFHVGTLCNSPESYVLGLRQTRALFDHELRNGRKMDIVDIGGGFLSEKTDDINEVSRLINETLEELFPDPSVQIIAEPGRYLSDSAFKMFCNIIGVRQVVRNNGTVNMIFMNNGRYGTMRFDEKWHKLRKFQLSDEPKPIVEQETILWGPTCDSTDRVMKHYPIKLQKCSANDWLTVDIHGAYTFTLSSRFSSMELPLIRSVVSKDLWKCLSISSVFVTKDFVQNPNISASLPSSMPSIRPAYDIYEHLEIPSLK